MRVRLQMSRDCVLDFQIDLSGDCISSRTSTCSQKPLMQPQVCLWSFFKDFWKVECPLMLRTAAVTDETSPASTFTLSLPLSQNPSAPRTWFSTTGLCFRRSDGHAIGCIIWSRSRAGKQVLLGLESHLFAQRVLYHLNKCKWQVICLRFNLLIVTMRPLSIEGERQQEGYDTRDWLRLERGYLSRQAGGYANWCFVSCPIEDTLQSLKFNMLFHLQFWKSNYSHEDVPDPYQHMLMSKRAIRQDFWVISLKNIQQINYSFCFWFVYTLTGIKHNHIVKYVKHIVSLYRKWRYVFKQKKILYFVMKSGSLVPTNRLIRSTRCTQGHNFAYLLDIL